MEKLPNQIQCNLCSCTFKNELILKCHLQCHGKSYVCKVCDAQFKCTRSLLIHTKLHV